MWTRTGKLDIILIQLHLAHNLILFITEMHVVVFNMCVDDLCSVIRCSKYQIFGDVTKIYNAIQSSEYCNPL
jgi:hypothetical protein